MGITKCCKKKRITAITIENTSKNSENLFSFINNKKINGKIIKIGKNFVSQSESLEIFKFSNKNFGLEKETFFP